MTAERTLRLITCEDAFLVNLFPCQLLIIMV